MSPEGRLVILALRPHYSCEDTWYSCPEHPDGSANEYIEGCNCSANEHNEEVLKIAKAIISDQEYNEIIRDLK